MSLRLNEPQPNSPASDAPSPSASSNQQADTPPLGATDATPSTSTSDATHSPTLFIPTDPPISSGAVQASPSSISSVSTGSGPNFPTGFIIALAVAGGLILLIFVAVIRRWATRRRQLARPQSSAPSDSDTQAKNEETIVGTHSSTRYDQHDEIVFNPPVTQPSLSTRASATKADGRVARNSVVPDNASPAPAAVSDYRASKVPPVNDSAKAPVTLARPPTVVGATTSPIGPAAGAGPPVAFVDPMGNVYALQSPVVPKGASAMPAPTAPVTMATMPKGWLPIYGSTRASSPQPQPQHMIMGCDARGSLRMSAAPMFTPAAHAYSVNGAYAPTRRESVVPMVTISNVP